LIPLPKFFFPVFDRGDIRPPEDPGRDVGPRSPSLPPPLQPLLSPADLLIFSTLHPSSSANCFEFEIVFLGGVSSPHILPLQIDGMHFPFPYTIFPPRDSIESTSLQPSFSPWLLRPPSGSVFPPPLGRCVRPTSGILILSFFFL